MKNYYQILGVNATASKEEIKEAYLKLSKKIHPDVNSGDNFFSELFKSINEAYQVLSDDDSRSAYNIKFNSYLYDFKFFKEKEQELQVRETTLSQTNYKRKLLLRSFLSIVVGICVVAVFSFALERRPYEEETFVSRDNQENGHVRTTNVSPKPNNTISTATEISTISPNPISTPIPAPENVFVKNETVAHPVSKKAPIKPIKEIELKKSEISFPESELTEANNPPVAESTNQLLPANLSEEKMDNLIAKIMEEKRNRNITVNCVRIIKSGNSNCENAFSIAQKFRSKGFILAGRETSSIFKQGISISYSKKMITIIIGSI